jgi:hypothetical protein
MKHAQAEPAQLLPPPDIVRPAQAPPAMRLAGANGDLAGAEARQRRGRGVREEGLQRKPQPRALVLVGQHSCSRLVRTGRGHPSTEQRTSPCLLARTGPARMNFSMLRSLRWKTWRQVTHSSSGGIPCPGQPWTRQTRKPSSGCPGGGARTSAAGSQPASARKLGSSRRRRAPRLSAGAVAGPMASSRAVTVVWPERPRPRHGPPPAAGARAMDAGRSGCWLAWRGPAEPVPRPMLRQSLNKLPNRCVSRYVDLQAQASADQLCFHVRAAFVRCRHRIVTDAVGRRVDAARRRRIRSTVTACRVRGQGGVVGCGLRSW